MTDLDIVKEIEKELKIKLEKVDEIAYGTRGYTIDRHSRVIGLSLVGCKIVKLERIESYLKKLEKLIELRLTDTNLISINSFSGLINLTILYLSSNQLKSISSISELNNLEELNLYNNQLTDISPISELKKLKKLYLENNRLTDISALKPLLENGMSIYISRGSREGIFVGENPLQTPPPSIVEEGREAVLRHFERIEKEGQETIYEAKLTLVGDGGAGKTSLKVRLMDETAELPNEDARTRGIDVKDWVIEENDSIKKIAHIWDFGGQDVYFPVHRFFLTENSVFVLLDSTRTPNHNFNYWIPTIFQFGGESPIIIGQTCTDGNQVPWNDLGYYVGHENFNIIKTLSKPYYELNLKNNNEGLDDIRKVILEQILNLPHFGKNIAKSWVKARKSLANAAKETPCISYDEFKRLCKNAGKGFEKSFDYSDAAIFFHSIGVSLWYNKTEGLKEWVILQPEWAVRAVYKIIDDKKIIDNEGHIEEADFERLWDDESYENRFGILKKMLEVFKIAFKKKHTDGDYIIPARLNSIPSGKRWQDSTPCIKLIYKYHFMPRGIVNQLSSDLSKYIIDGLEVWNNAVNLEKPLANCQVEEDYYSHEITIKAVGKNARDIIESVKDSLDIINRGYKGAKADILVPCTCKKCIGNPDPTTFKYEKLIEWSAEKEMVTCNESGDTIRIEQLLFNVGLDNPLNKENSSKEKTTINIFLASSSELEAERREFEILLGRENKRLNKENIFLDLTIWEDFIDAMAKDGLQKEYNKAVIESDIFVSLFFTKVGMFTEEEFEVAFGQFTKTGKPLVYTYFKTGQKVDLDSIDHEELKRKKEFEEKLKTLKHYKTTYTSTDNLLLKFKTQLEKVLPGLK